MRTTRLMERLGLEAPIIQAPMAGSTTPDLVAAVSNAGGLGSHGCAIFSPERLAEQVAAIEARTNRGYNLNFFVHRQPDYDEARIETMRRLIRGFHDELGLGEVPPAAPLFEPFDEACLEVCLAHRPTVVSFHFGLPAPDLLRPLQDKGIMVMSTATTVAEARWLAERGADAVIAQGAEAGGHRGTFLTDDQDAAMVGTMALVPQVVDAVAVPVIAAGGIADGRGVAAALALGAEAAQLGTAFLAVDEAGTAPLHRAALLDAAGENTRVTKSFSGRPARAIVNAYIEAMRPYEDALPDFPLAYAMNTTLRAAAAERGLADYLTLWSGQAVALNRSLPTAELMARLIAETERARSED